MAKVITPVNTQNKSSNFSPANDKWELAYLPFKGGVAIEEGTAVGYEVTSSNPTGLLIKMPATNANGQNFVGIITETIASTDADYATSGKLKGVLVAKSNEATAEFAVGAGTFTADDIGRVCAFHTDSKSLAVDTNGAGAEIVGFISSTRGVCKFNVPHATTA
jgi:hypothetical protein